MDSSEIVNAAIALFFLASMEIVLGIDNIVFITILTGRLPEDQRPRARRIGLVLALVMRLILLASLNLILKATKPVFTLTGLGIPEKWLESLSAVSTPGHGLDHAASAAEATAESAAVVHQVSAAMIQEINEISIRDLVLLLGGLFLLAKSVFEIHEKVNADHASHAAGGKKVPSFVSVLIQIAILDIVFSLDSVITAVGMAKQLWVMMAAVILAILVMLAFAGWVAHFVEKNPTLKMLALAFLILIGFMLVVEGVGAHFNKGYIYFAMAFSLGVEFLNIRVRSRHRHELEPVA